MDGHFQVQFFDGVYWTEFVPEGVKYAWRGLAFERLCLEHVRQIKAKLGISGVAVEVYAWRGRNADESNVQIDLILDRRDGIVNLCEMKFADGEYAIDKDELERMVSRKEAFRAVCGTRKSIHLTFITANGLRHNKYSGNVQSELTLLDLFAE